MCIDGKYKGLTYGNIILVTNRSEIVNLYNEHSADERADRGTLFHFLWWCAKVTTIPNDFVVNFGQYTGCKYLTVYANKQYIKQLSNEYDDKQLHTLGSRCHFLNYVKTMDDKL